MIFSLRLKFLKQEYRVGGVGKCKSAITTILFKYPISIIYIVVVAG